MPRCGLGRLSGYGDWRVCGAAGWRDRTVRPAGDIAWMRVSMRRCWNLGRTRRCRTTLRQRKAKPSAISGSRRRADAPLKQPMPVIMLQLARAAARGSVGRGRRSRRCASAHRSAGRRRWVGRSLRALPVATVLQPRPEPPAAVCARGRDARGARHWRAARSGECGESRQAERATGSDA